MPENIAYVSNFMSETISVIDLQKKKLVKNIRVGKYPVFSLGYAHDPKKLLVTLHNYEKKDGGGWLLLVDPLSGRVTRKIPYSGAAVPSGIMYDGKRDMVYVADENLNRVCIHDGRTLKLVSSLVAGNTPVHGDISGDGDHLVVTNRMSADLSVYDLERISTGAGDTVFTAIQLGGTTGKSCHPYDVKFSASPAICYVTDFDTGELLVVDTSRNRVIDRIRLGEKSFGMALDKSRTKAYVCNMGSGTVSVVALEKKKLIGEIKGMSSPSHCVIHEKGQQLVVTDQGGSTDPGVHIIDLATEKITRTITDKMIQSPIGVTLGE
jgi:YVTN family beta-propeller protein